VLWHVELNRPVIMVLHRCEDYCCDSLYPVVVLMVVKLALFRLVDPDGEFIFERILPIAVLFVLNMGVYPLNDPLLEVGPAFIVLRIPRGL